MNLGDTMVSPPLLKRKKPVSEQFGGEYVDSKTAMGEIMARKQHRRMLRLAQKEKQYAELHLKDDWAEKARQLYADHSEADFAENEDDYIEVTDDFGGGSGMSDLEWRRALKAGKFKGAFAGEGLSFPIASAEDVRRSWASIGRTKQDRGKVLRKIIRIAKKYGWTSGLPQSVKDRMKEGKSGLPEKYSK